MKNVLSMVTAILLVLSYGKTVAQKSIAYGSNNGKYLTVKGSKIYYEEYGRGVPLILMHGGLSTISNFKYVIPELSKQFRVIAIDAPGQGRSEQADSLSFQLMADYTSDIIDQLKFDSVYVYGFSVGGITALHLAADRADKVKRTLIHAAAFNRSGYTAQFDGTDQLTPEIVEGNIQWWLEGHRNKSPQKEKWKKFITDFRNMWYPGEFISEQKLRSIKNHVLIVQGDKDLVKIDHAMKMHELIANSQFSVLPGTTHFSLEENPDLTSKIAVDFFLRKGKVRELDVNDFMR